MHKKKWNILPATAVALTVCGSFVSRAETEKKDNYIVEYEELLDDTYNKLEDAGEGEQTILVAENRSREYIDELAAYLYRIYDYTGEVLLLECVSERNPDCSRLLIRTSDGAETVRKQKETVRRIQKFCEEIINSSETEKIQKIHDWVKSTVEYDYSFLGNSCYSALIEGKSACNGYARLFNAACSYVGIECEDITGWYGDKYHIWNRVKADGTWRYIDVTWNDCAGEDRWFMITREQMNRDHVEEIKRKGVSRIKRFE